MGGNTEERLRWKEPLHSLEIELQGEFGLSPVASRALVRRLEQFLDTYVDGQPGARAAGQLYYPAVARGERAGKPVRHCLTVPVALTWLHPEDAAVLGDGGSPTLRRVRLARMCSEAFRQGAVLSHEDLSLLLGVDGSTVGRMVRSLAEHGHERPPTRGLVEDIGPTVSHKEEVLQLYFQGLLPARIAARTGHGLGSVERYLSDFARVAELCRQGLPTEASVRITGMSPALVRRYREWFERFNRPEHRPVLQRLLRRFAPIEERDSEGEGVKRG